MSVHFLNLNTLKLKHTVKIYKGVVAQDQEIQARLEYSRPGRHHYRVKRGNEEKILQVIRVSLVCAVLRSADSDWQDNMYLCRISTSLQHSTINCYFMNKRSERKPASVTVTS